MMIPVTVMYDLKENLIIITCKFGYSPFRGNAPEGAIRRIFTIAFLLFLAPEGVSNPAGSIA